MSGPAREEFAEFGARTNHDGTLNIYADGAALPGGQNLTEEALLRVLSRFAGEEGTVLLTTMQLNGTVTRDLIDETGTAIPYYEPAQKSPGEPEHEEDPHRDDDLLLAAMKTRGTPGSSTWEEPAAAAVPRHPRMKLELSSTALIPEYDVEGDIRKALSSSTAKPAGLRTMMITGCAVAAAAVAGVAFYLLSGSILA